MDVNLPFHLWEGMRLWIVPPDNGLVRETKVLTARAGDEAHNTQIVTLEGIDGIEGARRLAGRFLLAYTADLPEEVQVDEDLWTGLRVQDERLGFIGIITEKRGGAGQDLLVVKGPYGEVLIPAVDEFLGTRDAATLFVKLPKGLVETGR
jgi:16S rRNA processing protein RimM